MPLLEPKETERADASPRLSSTHDLARAAYFQITSRWHGWDHARGVYDMRCRIAQAARWKTAAGNASYEVSADSADVRRRPSTAIHQLRQVVRVRRLTSCSCELTLGSSSDSFSLSIPPAAPSGCQTVQDRDYPGRSMSVRLEQTFADPRAFAGRPSSYSPIDYLQRAICHDKPMPDLAAPDSSAERRARFPHASRLTPMTLMCSSEGLRHIDQPRFRLSQRHTSAVSCGG